MSSDMTVSCDNGLINIRVGAIIMKDGKIVFYGTTEQAVKESNQPTFEEAYEFFI